MPRRLVTGNLIPEAKLIAQSVPIPVFVSNWLISFKVDRTSRSLVGSLINESVFQLSLIVDSETFVAALS